MNVNFRNDLRVHLWGDFWGRLQINLGEIDENRFWLRDKESKRTWNTIAYNLHDNLKHNIMDYLWDISRKSFYGK